MSDLKCEDKPKHRHRPVSITTGYRGTDEVSQIKKEIVMNAIKILLSKLLSLLKLVGIIIIMPIIVVEFIVKAWHCDDHEWEGIGYDD